MSKQELIPDQSVITKIHLIRGVKVMLDIDLAELYGVETKQFKRAVKRNIIRFPEDFMFELNKEELATLRYQIGTSKNENRGGIRYAPMAFTEQGVAMLSSVLNSKRAILMNIHIIRIFTRMRDLLGSHKEILERLDQFEIKFADHDDSIKRIFEHIRALINPASSIGFNYNNKT